MFFKGVKPHPRRLMKNRYNAYYNSNMKFEEIEGIILKDGWKLKTSNGSHFQYKHHVKSGKVTIPYHRGDILTRKRFLQF